MAPFIDNVRFRKEEVPLPCLVPRGQALDSSWKPRVNLGVLAWVWSLCVGKASVAKPLSNASFRIYYERVRKAKNRPYRKRTSPKSYDFPCSNLVRSILTSKLAHEHGRVNMGKKRIPTPSPPKKWQRTIQHLVPWFSHWAYQILENPAFIDGKSR